MMRKYARQGSTLPVIRGLALKLTNAGFGTVRGLPQKDFTGESQRLFTYVRDNIRYVKDPDGTEFLHPADWVLQIGAGDCDDKAILLAALLLSLGHQPRFIAVAMTPDLFRHVWVQDLLNDTWVDLEPTESLPFGRSIPMGEVKQTMTLDVWE